MTARSRWHPVGDDVELLVAWRKGNTQAGDALVRRYFAAVWGFFRRRSPGSADDLTQRTFEACVRATELYRGEGSVRSFLFGIAHRQLLMELRSQQRERLQPADLRDAPASGDSPSQVRHDKERRRVILRATRSLPLDQQVLLDLYYWQELTGAEIAAVVGVEPGTVRTRLSRARQQLLDVLQSMDIGQAVVDSTITHLHAMRDEGP